MENLEYISVESIVESLIQRSRQAFNEFRSADQQSVDEAVTAVAWSLYKPNNARKLAELAVQDTELGNVSDKIIKTNAKRLAPYATFCVHER